MVWILRLSVFPLDILFNNQLLGGADLFTIWFFVTVGVYVVATFIVLIIYKKGDNSFKCGMIPWHLFGMINAFLLGVVISPDNIVIHDNFYKIKLPLYIVQFLTAMTMLRVLFRPGNTVQ